VAKSKGPKKTTVTKSAKAKPKPAKPKKPTPSSKPKKPEQGNVQELMGGASAGAGVPIARPRITSPVANADVDDMATLTVTGVVNIGTVRYRLELWDGTTMVGSWIATPDDSMTVRFTISEKFLADGKVYRLVLRVHPDDGSTPPHLDHTITITTTWP